MQFVATSIGDICSCWFLFETLGIVPCPCLYEVLDITVVLLKLIERDMKLLDSNEKSKENRDQCSSGGLWELCAREWRFPRSEQLCVVPCTPAGFFTMSNTNL